MIDFNFNNDVIISGTEDITKDKNGVLIASGLLKSAKTLSEHIFNNQNIDPAQAQVDFHPFENESEQFMLGGMTFENREDRISVYGELVITSDISGFVLAKRFYNTLLLISSTLKDMKDLPDMITVDKPETIANPFA